jgi:hypothetical protein
MVVRFLIHDVSDLFRKEYQIFSAKINEYKLLLSMSLRYDAGVLVGKPARSCKDFISQQWMI